MAGAVRPSARLPSRLSLDIETFSSVDLSRSGVYRYAEAQDFSVLLVGYSFDFGPVQCVDLAAGEVLLDELIRRRPEDVFFKRTLDLGCGYALTSLFVANETDAEHVYALDLWIPATENYLRIKANGLEDKIIPIHGDAMDMPFAHDYFDTIVSVDAYHYFGCKEGIFSEKILPFVKKGGSVMIVVPGLKEQPQGELKKLFETWAEGDDAEYFKTAAWWKNLLKEECKDRCRIEVKEAECYDIAWQEWFESGHEYGIRDKEFLGQGLYDILNFLLIYVRKE